MPHYSTSGYRWPCKVSNELAREMVSAGHLSFTFSIFELLNSAIKIGTPVFYTYHIIVVITSFLLCKAKPKSYVSNARRSFHTLRVLKANSVFNFPRAVDTEMKNTTKGVEHHLPNALASKPWAVFASVIKRLSRRG